MGYVQIRKPKCRPPIGRIHKAERLNGRMNKRPNKHGVGDTSE